MTQCYGLERISLQPYKSTVHHRQHSVYFEAKAPSSYAMLLTL